MARTSRFHVFLGVLLILFGLAILVKRTDVFNWAFIRSYGFLTVGLIGLFKSVSESPRRGIYLYSVLTGIGLYFVGGELEIYTIERGLTLSVLTLIFGLAFYSVFFLSHRSLESLLYGNILVLLGLIFFLVYLDIFPSNLFVRLIDTYWPVIIILFGIGLHFKSRRKEVRKSIDSSSSS